MGSSPTEWQMGLTNKMNKLLGILKYISLSRDKNENPKEVSMRMDKLRKVSRRMRAVSQPAGSLDPLISRKLEQANKE
jgi:hypothetical protein